MPIIDVHTHMFTRHWLELLRTQGDPYGVQVRPDGREEIFRGRTPVVFRPNVYWGSLGEPERAESPAVGRGIHAT